MNLQPTDFYRINLWECGFPMEKEYQHGGKLNSNLNTKLQKWYTKTEIILIKEIKDWRSSFQMEERYMKILKIPKCLKNWKLRLLWPKKLFSLSMKSTPLSTMGFLFRFLEFLAFSKPHKICLIKLEKFSSNVRIPFTRMRESRKDKSKFTINFW